MFSILFLFIAGAEAAAVMQQSADRIEPSLDPKSDKKFMQKDYPFDKRSITDEHYVFDHPYPAVQDSGDFDRDFVKDENSDGGRWDAQMTYDTLRAKIIREKAKLEELKKKMEQEYKDWQHAKKESGLTEDELAKAKKEVEAARKTANAAAKRVNDLEGSSQKDGTKVGGAIGRAVKDVQGEMDDLEKCKKALAEAKQRLKDLLRQKEEDEAKAKAKKEKDEKDREVKVEAKVSKKSKKDSEEEKKKQGTKEADKNGAKDDKKEGSGKTDEEKAEADWKKEIAKDTKSVSDWRKNYLKELDDVRQTEKALEEAARTLKKFRRSPYVDDNGGVYNVPQERSLATTPSSRVFAVAALSLFLPVLAL